MARKQKPATVEESSQFEKFDYSLLRSIRVSLRGLLILALFAAIYFACKWPARVTGCDCEMTAQIIDAFLKAEPTSAYASSRT